MNQLIRRAYQNRRLGWIVLVVLLFVWFVAYASFRCPTGSRYDPAAVTFNDADEDASTSIGTDDDVNVVADDSDLADLSEDTDADVSVSDEPEVVVPKSYTVGRDSALDSETKKRRDGVKEAFLHAWKGYRKYAWGTDELRPTSNTGMDWLGLGATIVDSLDTLWIMGLHDEFKDARDWIATKFNINKHADVSVFETMIRVVGGFGAAFDLSGDEVFLKREREVADALMWAFNTSSGIPFATINLATHSGSSPGWTGGNSILAEVGTVQLELKHLSHHLNNDFYANKAERIIDVLDKQQKRTKGLYGLYINPHSGDITNDMTSFGALGDSFYEYLLKQWLFTGQTESKYRRMYDEMVVAVRDKLIKKSRPSGLTYIAEWNSGSASDKMDHLACFSGGMFALGAAGASSAADKRAQLQLGAEITETCAQMYQRSPTGIGPEMVYFRDGQDFVTGASYYILRPETVESLFVLWRLTHEQKWRDYGWDMLQALNKHCRTSSGYAGLRDVNQVPPSRDDQQQSFFLAETLKYLYLLFSEDELISLDEWVFNTEAHPLRRIG